MTTVEYLLEKIETLIGSKIANDEICITQAVEFEKEMLHQVWKASEQNMRSHFCSSAYKNITFEDHYEALRSNKY